MVGKRGGTRVSTRLAVVFALTVLGSVAFSGIAAAAPSTTCIGRQSVSCTTTHNTRGTSIVEGTDSATPTSAVVEAPAAVSAPVEAPQAVSAPSAPKASPAKAGAIRTDHKGHDSEPDPDTGVDPDCDEDDVDDEPEADDDEDCTSGISDPEPCDDDADEEGDDDEEEGEEDEDCVEPEPAVEICGDGIDNDKDGRTDEDCEAPVTPVPPAPPAPPAPPKTVVLPRQVDRLPTTGADVTSLFLIGLTLVAIGGATRIRTRPLRAVFAGQGSAAELILVHYLNHVATQRTIQRRRR